MDIFRFKVSLILLTLVFQMCSKEQPDYDDTSIMVDNQPSLSVYKTKDDYFNYIAINQDSLETITSYPVYGSKDVRIKIYEGKITYNRRWKLKSGYIVDKEMSYEKVFTNVTFQEQIEYTEIENGNISSDWYKQRIIDKDPFIEYYWLDGLNKPYREFTLGEIDRMITDGTIEISFIRIK